MFGHCIQKGKETSLMYRIFAGSEDVQIFAPGYDPECDLGFSGVPDIFRPSHVSKDVSLNDPRSDHDNGIFELYADVISVMKILGYQARD